MAGGRRILGLLGFAVLCGCGCGCGSAPLSSEEVEQARTTLTSDGAEARLVCDAIAQGKDAGAYAGVHLDELAEDARSLGDGLAAAPGGAQAGAQARLHADATRLSTVLARLAASPDPQSARGAAADLDSIISDVRSA
jgi:hypothetical protein